MAHIFNKFEKSYQIDSIHLDNPDYVSKIDEIVKDFVFTADTVNRIGKQFELEMDLALNEDTVNSSLQMENTYIPELPDGTESGKYLALDLGGTNFRVILLELEKGAVKREIVKMYHIESDLRIGDEDVGLALFDYLAKCLCDFVAENDLVAVPLPLGFTFSFPMQQHSLSSATLVAWAKSFNLPSIIGCDVVKLLRDALHNYGHNHIEVVSILNDTTSTLIQGVNLDKRTRIGIVLGTGSNAAYVESADRVKHWETTRFGEERVCIDIEWGAFGDKGSLDYIRTEFDDELDKCSLLPGAYTFEKYIGGKYLGELMRLILEKLYKEEILFLDTPEETFPKPWTFETSMISKIELDNMNGTTCNTEEVLNECGFQRRNHHFTAQDIHIVKYIAAIVSQRAALLVSITTAILLKRISDNDVTIAIDGSVYKHHPRMDGWLCRIIRALAPAEKQFRLMLAEDGSGKGAGLTAAIALRLERKRKISCA